MKVTRGFTELKHGHAAAEGQAVHSCRDTVVDLSRIKQMLFGHFRRCLYRVQKFDSDTERRFAVLLERDAMKWFRPVRGQFQIYYRLGIEQPEYVPDFVVETEELILMVETKARNNLNEPEVIAKSVAAVRWCEYASEHARKVRGKPWRYLLIPHDEVTESLRLQDYLRFREGLNKPVPSGREQDLPGEMNILDGCSG